MGISRSIHKCLCCSESFIIIFQLIIVIHRQTFQNKIIWIFYNHFIYKIQRFLILLIKEKQCCITRLIAFEMIGISHITCISFYRLIIFAILKICFGQFALCNSRIRFQFQQIFQLGDSKTRINREINIRIFHISFQTVFIEVLCHFIKTARFAIFLIFNQNITFEYINRCILFICIQGFIQIFLIFRHYILIICF